MYPKKLRRVAVWNEENKQVIELISNQFAWTANTIVEFYKSRWVVEIFFRGLKQLLHTVFLQAKRRTLSLTCTVFSAKGISARVLT